MIDYTIKPIPGKQAIAYMVEHHYSHGCHNGPSPCFGLFDGEHLIGACVFATPCSERVRASVFGADYKDRVTELHRLHILDCTPKNTESWFVSRCLKLLKQQKPHIWAVVSFSDLTAGHKGVVYQACNAFAVGETEARRFYVDQSGRLRHPRQCGVNISLEEAKRRGWEPVKRAGKNRYLFLLPDRRPQRKRLIEMARCL